MDTYDFISRLHPDRTDWVIKVRIEKKWTEKRFGARRGSLSFLLMDEEGELVQAYVYHQRQIWSCDQTMHEGQWKCISNFVVFEDGRDDPNTASSYAIRICENTDILDISPIEADDGIGFEPIEQIVGEAPDLDLPTNTLGFMVSMEDLKTVDD